MSTNKSQIIEAVLDCLRQSLGTLEKAARASHAEATHESSKAENKYDTRGLEAAYLAGGQARQAKELMESIAMFESLEAKDFGPNEQIDLAAVVELEADGAPSSYFVGPKSGGLEFNFGGKEIMVITPQSPLGHQLIGKKAGQHWTTKLGGSSVKYRVISVR
jgi:transcription elongation GreA/GreB family factor